MDNSTNSLWALLNDSDLVNGSLPTDHEDDSPWFVKILLGFSGWLAALFLLAFLGIMFSSLLDKPLGSFLTGVALLLVAYFQLTQIKNEFVSNLAFVFSLVGQVLIYYGIFQVFDDFNRTILVVIIAVELILFILIPHFIHKIFTISSAALAFMVLCVTYHFFFVGSSLLLLTFAYLSLNEFKFFKHQEMVQAAIYGLIFAILIFYFCIPLDLFQFFYFNDISKPDLLFKLNYWLNIFLLVILIVFCVTKILQRQNINLTSKEGIIFFIATFIFCYVGFNAHGVILSSLILVCGFANSNRVLQGLGITCLLFFTSKYYYSLDITLIEKSKHLLILGICLLAVRWISSILLTKNSSSLGVSANV